MTVNRKTGEVADDAHIRPFADWLREQARGTSHEELSEALVALVARVQETGKKGSITYTVHVEQMKDSHALVVKDEIKIRLPEHDRSASLFFADKHNNLTRHDPAQMTFESLREVPAADAAAADLKDAR